MTKLALSIMVHAYRHVHAAEDCNSPRSMKASLKAMRIIEDAVGEEEFFHARKWHRNHCKECKRRGWGPSAIPVAERLKQLSLTVDSLLGRVRQLREDEEAYEKKYGNSYKVL